jgi:hypothetical protein
MIRVCLFTLFVASSLFLFSQTPPTSQALSLQLPGKFYTKIQKKLSSIDDKLTKKSLKYLAKFQRQELRIEKKLRRIDSLKAHDLFAGSERDYANFTCKIKLDTINSIGASVGEYLPYLDSLQGSLTFLQQNKISRQLSQLDGISNAGSALNSVNQLQNRLQNAEAVKQFIKQRKKQIRETLQGYAFLPGGIKNAFKAFNKSAYYYSEQVKEYKDLLNDPEKIEKKALWLLNQLPAFHAYMKEHSCLEGLFNLPGGYSTPQALTGLQTRAQVEQIITNQIGGGRNATQLFSQQVQAAREQLNQFKNKLSKVGGGGDIEMPDFIPNGQKTKSLTQRLQFGFDIQFARNNSLVPSTGDMALSVGYKLNDKSMIGIGMSYKLGIGSFQHIHLTNQGIGLRNFLEYKIKKQIFITGGYEVNYNSAFRNIEQLKNYNAWQKSGLAGFSKKYKISKKVKGNAQLLYDFLAHSHVPSSQSILFRIGYNF